MIFNAENILLIGSILLFVSIVVSKTGYRFGILRYWFFYWSACSSEANGLGLQFHDDGRGTVHRHDGP